MLSIFAAAKPDPSLQPARPRQYRLAGAVEIPLLAALLYLLQVRTNVWMLVFCCCGFALVMVAFIRLLQQKTQRSATLFSTAYGGVLSLAALINFLFFLNSHH